MPAILQTIPPFSFGMGGEFVQIVAPRTWKNGSGKPCVILAEGSPNDFGVCYSSTQFQQTAQAIVDAGYLVINAALGTNAWGNSTCQTRITNAIAYARSVYGVHPTKVGLVGYSMGSLNVLAWAGNNAAQVAFVHLWCPLPNLQAAASDATLGAGVNAAYGGTYTNATYGAVSNPQTMAAAGKYAGMKIRLEYASDDTLALPSYSTTFASTVGGSLCTTVNLGTGGHNMVHCRNTASLGRLIADLDAIGTTTPPPPTGQGQLIAALSDITSSWIPQHATPAAVNAHLRLISTPSGPGWEMTCNDNDITPWDSNCKAIFARKDPIVDNLGKTELYTFDLYLPNQTLTNTWHTGLLIEWHTEMSSGHHLCLDMQTGTPRFRIGRNLGSYTYELFYGPAPVWNTWIPVRFEIKWSTGSDGFLRVDIGGTRYVNFTGGTTIPGESTPYVQWGWYSRRGAGLTNTARFGNLRKLVT